MPTEIINENLNLEILPSASRTTTQTVNGINWSSKGCHLVIDVTSAGTGSITPSIQGVDANGIAYTLITGAAITTAVAVVLRLYPGLTAVANLTVSDLIPYKFKVIITANNANAMTYSVGMNLIK